MSRDSQHKGLGSTAATPQAQSVGMSIGGLRFNPPKSFDGKEQIFEEWAYKLRAYLALSNPKFKKLMMECEKDEEKVDFDLLDGPEKIMSAQLQKCFDIVM